MNNISKIEYHFIKTLCGQYTNKLQAHKYPKLYAHINIYFRLVPINKDRKLYIYSEQSYDHSPWSPYRQAVHTISYKENMFILSNYMISNSDRIAGAGFTLDLLKEISITDLTLRKDCEMSFYKINNDSYRGFLKKERKCIVKRNEHCTYLVSNVIFNKNKFLSKDEGYDIKTNQKIWGSNHGYLVFRRVNE